MPKPFTNDAMAHLQRLAQALADLESSPSNRTLEDAHEAGAIVAHDNALQEEKQEALQKLLDVAVSFEGYCYVPAARCFVAALVQEHLLLV